jgi:hypothetical protein
MIQQLACFMVEEWDDEVAKGKMEQEGKNLLPSFHSHTVYSTVQYGKYTILLKRQKKIK